MVLYKRSLENGRELSFSYRDLDHDRLMIFLPGISGNAMDEKFRYLEEIAVHSGYSMVRMDFQFQQYKDESLTPRDCVMDILAVVEYLRRRDINTAKEIVVIAKSLGALIYHLIPMVNETDIKVSKAILLAPYLKLADKRIDFLDTPLNELKDDKIYMDKALLQDIPILIFHGLKDKVLDIENSQHIAQCKPNYVFERINTDHGFNEADTHNIVVKKSLKFLNGEL